MCQATNPHCFGCLQVVWAVRHSHIGDAFFDLDAAAFLCTQLPQARSPAHSSIAEDCSAQHSAVQHSEIDGSAAQRPHAVPTRPHKEPNSVQRQAKNVETQELTATQAPTAFADNSATQDSADEQADSAAQSSAEGLDFAQVPESSQHQLPQRTRQQRRGTRRRTDKKPSPCPEDQPDLNHVGSDIDSKVKAEQVCDRCLSFSSSSDLLVHRIFW